jgi:ATP-dependent exoDNAse (exonuclease V) beta subunit
LYVAITRAKKDLIITWNTGRSGKSSPAEAVLELIKYLTYENKQKL